MRPIDVSTRAGAHADAPFHYDGAGAPNLLRFGFSPLFVSIEQVRRAAAILT